MYRLPSWKNLDLFAIKVIGTDDPTAKAVSAYTDRYVGEALHSASAIYDRDITLGRTYIYPKNPVKESTT